MVLEYVWAEISNWNISNNIWMLDKMTGKYLQPRSLGYGSGEKLALDLRTTIHHQRYIPESIGVEGLFITLIWY